MHTRNVNLGRRLLAASAILMVLLTACARADADATPTLSVDEIFTAAFHTSEAQLATQLALTPPTETPSPSPFPTLPPPSPVATISFSTAPASGGTACDKAEFVADVTIPDGTTIPAGQKFVKTWRIINLGTCTWSNSYKLVFENGDAMGGVSTFITVPVTPQNQAEISVNLTAPTANGTYKGNWRMQNANSQPFGSTIYVEIKVGSGATSTAGPSPTPGEGDVTISGSILGGFSGNFTISWAGEGINDSQDFDGDSYTITVPNGWDGTVTPSKTNRTFDPVNRTFTNVTTNQTGQDFTIH